MSFLTDLFKGNFGHLGTDLAHDPLGTAAAVLGTAGLGAFALPALAPALGIGAAEAGAGAAGAAGAAEAGGALAGGLTPGAALLSGTDIAADAGTAALGGAWAGAPLAGTDAFAAVPAAGAAGAGGGISDAAFLGDIQAGINSGAALPGETAGAASPGGFSLSSLVPGTGTLAALGIGGLGTLLAPKLSGLVNKVPQQAQLTNLAQNESAFGSGQAQLGQTLTQPLLTGQLPQGAQSTVDQAFEDAVNTTKARYASLGLSGSTMEADAIAAQTKQKEQATFSIAQQMAQQGAQATNTAATAFGLQDAVYSQLMNAQVQQDTALQNAIARLAAGAALGAGTNQGTKTAAAAANVFQQT